MAKLITFAHYYNPYEAQIVQAFLKSHDIYAVVPEWHHSTMAWHHIFALNGLRVCVCDADLEDARAVIDEANTAYDKQESPSPLPDTTQPLGRRVLCVALWWWSGIATPFWRQRRYWSSE